MKIKDYMLILVLIINLAVIIAIPGILYSVKINDNAWKIGDDIKPWPASNWTDCDDAALYTYYFINGAKPHYDVTIMYSRGEDKSHTWLSVTGDGNTIAYNNGKAVNSDEMAAELVEGGLTSTVPETIQKLIWFVEQDFIVENVGPSN